MPARFVLVGLNIWVRATSPYIYINYESMGGNTDPAFPVQSCPDLGWPGGMVLTSPETLFANPLNLIRLVPA